MPNPQKRWILSAILSAGLAGSAVSAPAKPAPKTKKPAAARPTAPSSGNVRRAPSGVVDIAGRPRVTVKPARATTPVRRVTVTAVRRPSTSSQTARSSRSVRAARRLAQQPGMGRRGAFSVAPLRSKAALMRELRSNSPLRKNLAKHFGVPESRLLAYVENNLEFSYLRRDRITFVMGVTRTGKHFKVRQRIPKGTPVFALSDRTPIMKSICGNPIVFRLPPVPSPVTVSRPIKPPGVLTVEVTPETVPGRPSVPGTLPITAALPPVVETDLPPTFEVAYAGEPVGTLDMLPGERRRRGGGFPWWVGGAAVPFFFLDDDDDDGGTLIPEPNSIALFAAGGVPLIAWLRRRSRKDSEAAAEETSSGES